MDIIVLLQQAVLNHASDIFVVAGLPVSYRANGRICREKEEKLMPPQTKECVEELYKLAGGRDIRVLEEKGDDDFSFAVPGLSRFRVSAYKQRGALSAVIRVITFELPEPNEIGIPDPVMSFYNLSKGLVLVTGPAGSGKSTTLACLVDKINHSMEKHIITLEDPIEYLHRHDKSIVSQREIKVDTERPQATVIPIERHISEPSPVPTAIGIIPKTVVNVVINTGRRRDFPAVTTDVIIPMPRSRHKIV